MNRKHPPTIIILFVTFMALLTSAQALPTPKPPAVTAKAYILQDAHSGYIIASSNTDLRLDPASITKIMTSYIVFEALQNKRVQLTDITTISETAWRNPKFSDWKEGSSMFANVGAQIKLQDALRGLITQSGNDSAVALAEHIAGSEAAFADIMNATAQKLGMKNSHFTNSSGFPEENHYTTAQDIATLSRALILSFPEYYRYFGEKEFTYDGIHQPNRNGLLWQDSSVDGIKTGHTESAGYCLAASALRNGMRLISVVMNTASVQARETYSLALLNYGFNFFETHKLYTANKPLHETRIWEGTQEKLSLGITQDLFITIPRGQYQNLKPGIEIPNTITAPVQKGAALGTIRIQLDGQTLASNPLVALQEIPQGSFFQRIIDRIKQWLQ